jgi:hypothetical protein
MNPWIKKDKFEENYSKKNLKTDNKEKSTSCYVLLFNNASPLDKN